MFLILLALSWSDLEWATRGAATILAVGSVLGFFSGIYALLNFAGIRVKHDPTGPYTFEHDPVRIGDVLVTFLLALILAALAAAVFSFLP